MKHSKNKRGKVTLIVEPVDRSNGKQTSDTDTEEPTGNGTGGKIAIVVVGAILVAGVCVVIWWKRKIIGWDGTGNYEQTAAAGERTYYKAYQYSRPAYVHAVE